MPQPTSSRRFSGKMMSQGNSAAVYMNIGKNQKAALRQPGFLPMAVSCFYNFLRNNLISAISGKYDSLPSDIVIIWQCAKPTVIFHPYLYNGFPFEAIFRLVQMLSIASSTFLCHYVMQYGMKKPVFLPIAIIPYPYEF